MVLRSAHAVTSRRKPMSNSKDAVRKILDLVKADKRTSLTAPEGKLVCDAYGIPVPKEEVAKSASEAAKIATDMGFPVVMKIVSPDILHKTEAGGVIVGVKTATEVEKNYATILANAKKYKADAKIEGVQVQQMLAGGTEVIVGSITDGSFGKLVAFGLGGVLVEVLKDITFRLAPATKDDALSMLDGIQAHDMLKGVRGGDPVSREALADIIVKVSQLVSDFPEIVELDLNPVFATKKDAIAADVRIVVDFDYKPRPKPRPTEEIVKAMNRIMMPKAVAVIGASTEDGKIGNSVMKNLINGGYKGDILPIHPKAEEILGYKAYKSVKDVPGVIDVAVFAIPAKFVAGALAECGERTGHELGGDRKDSDVDHAGHILDALVGLVAQDLFSLGMDRQDIALVAAVDEVLHHGVADLAVLGGGADHRNRFRHHDAVHCLDDLFGRARFW